MGTMASQIISLTIVYSSVYSDADQRKYQSSASLAFVWGNPRRPVDSSHKGPVTLKMFPFDDVRWRHHPLRYVKSKPYYPIYGFWKAFSIASLCIGICSKAENGFIVNAIPVYASPKIEDNPVISLQGHGQKLFIQLEDKNSSHSTENLEPEWTFSMVINKHYLI